MIRIIHRNISFYAKKSIAKQCLKIDTNDRERERERGDNGLFITLVQKFYSNVFLFVGLTTLRNIVNFDWLDQ